jgi:hypothetical protein
MGPWTNSGMGILIRLAHWPGYGLALRHVFKVSGYCGFSEKNREITGWVWSEKDKQG